MSGMKVLHQITLEDNLNMKGKPTWNKKIVEGNKCYDMQLYY